VHGFCHAFFKSANVGQFDKKNKTTEAFGIRKLQDLHSYSTKQALGKKQVNSLPGKKFVG
jgi:hypothetical protein